MSRLSQQEWEAAGLTGWVRLCQAIHTRVKTRNFVTGAELVAAITELAEAANHHPDLTLRYPNLDIRLLSHDVGAVTERDVALARQIDELVAARGLSADPDSMVQVEFGLDAADAGRLMPFWYAILGYRKGSSDDEVLDPDAQGPNVWFQGTDEHEAPRQRWHPDVWVSPAEATRRTAVAIEAGGTLVDDSHAPSFVVLADPDGNKVCLCTTEQRA